MNPEFDGMYLTILPKQRHSTDMLSKHKDEPVPSLDSSSIQVISYRAFTMCSTKGGGALRYLDREVCMVFLNAHLNKKAYKTGKAHV